MSDAVKRLNAALEGRYRIERELGEGGMATVYLADDLRHERKVALKVLKPELAAVVGAERFLAEIKTTANLQHPHILPLHDSGEADGLLFYVMPYVRGESLRDRLDREHQLPVDEAVGIAAAVAGALDYAHQHGVVHRDIKPANILIQAGQPVVGDFGIALAVGAAGGARITETGLSVGTPYYMSPEQATGDVAVGARSDIYALGCVLYEMLTGEPPYTGKTAQAVLGRIIQGVPVSATAVRTSVPPNVDAAIRKALEKLPADRFTAARDFAGALAAPSFRHGEAAGDVSGGGAVIWRRTASALGAVAALLALALGWTLLSPTPAPPVARYGIEFLPGQQPMDVLSPTLALAPDGSAIVYVGPGGDSGQLWLKPRDRVEAMPLAGTDGARSPLVSPDGTMIMYQAGDQLRKIPFVGGASVTLADSLNTTANVPVAWLDDGTVVYLDSSWRFRRMPAEGGSAEIVWTPPEGRYAFFPKALPGSQGFLFTLCNANCTEFFEIWALDLETGEARSLVPGSVMAEYAATGHMLYVRPDGSVFAQPFDPGSLEVEGGAVPVLEGVKVDGGAVPDLALSPDGMVLMRTGSSALSFEVEFVWVTREGQATPVHPGWSFEEGGANRGWSLSPDGTMLAARIWTEAGYDIWVKALPEGPFSRLTFYEGEDRKPRWSPDGSRVTFLSDRGGDLDVWSARPDGVGEPTLLYDHDVELAAGFWAPDGEWLVLRTGGIGGELGGRDILAVRPGTDTLPVQLMAADFDESAPAVSPDSRWIAYRSNETGRDEVFVRPFPDVDGGKWQVSTEGGTAPLWAHNGEELFYVSPDRDLVAAQIEGDGTFRVGERRVLFRLEEEYVVTAVGTGWYDIAPDDERFLFVRQAGSGSEEVNRTILVENWFEELRAAVGR